MRIEKSVFISYRRTNLAWALNVYQHLSKNGYDVFFDYSSINSGNFEQIIIDNIKSRAHFLVILTPSALERCEEPNDWLRREIEMALDTKRNIIPVFFEGFSFSNPSISKYLTGGLANLSKYNGVEVPNSYFDEAMERIQKRYLNTSLDLVIHPASPAAKAAAVAEQKAADKKLGLEPKKKAVNEKVQKELSAEEWLEKGLDLDDGSDEEIQCYTEAIRLKPDYAEAYKGRGDAYSNLEDEDYEAAIQDYSDAIRLKPNYPEAYKGRGDAYTYLDDADYEGAIKDYNEAIRLKPNYPEAYKGRGDAYTYLDDADYEGAIKDYNEAIRLKPDYADAYLNRGLARDNKGDREGAIKDYNEAIRLQPDDEMVYYKRGLFYEDKGNNRGAIADYQKYLDLGGGIRNGDQETIEQTIRDLKKKL